MDGARPKGVQPQPRHSSSCLMHRYAGLPGSKDGGRRAPFEPDCGRRAFAEAAATASQIARTDHWRQKRKSLLAKAERASELLEQRGASASSLERERTRLAARRRQTRFASGSA